ncbi:MAG: CdaR family protein [Chloroflexota bacterium]
MKGLLSEIAQELLQVGWSFVQRVGDSLRRNYGLALLALLLSAGLWLLISVEQNPPKVDVFASSIPVEPVNVPRDLDILGGVPTVLVRISAPPEVWERIGRSSFRATADLSQASAGTYEAPVHVEAGEWRVRILDIIPANVAVRLAELTRQTIPVHVNLLGTPPPGYSVGTPSVNPERVTVLGPEPLVGQVDAAAADVTLTGVTVNINQSFRLKPRTARGYEIEGVTLDPPSAVVEIDVSQQILYSSFSVSPQIAGELAPGYWVSGLSVRPPIVTLAGTRDVLQPIAFLETLPVDVNGASTNLVRPIGLRLPKGANPVGVENVVVYVSISPTEGSRMVGVAPVFKGLAPGLRIMSSLGSVDVALTGELPTLRALKPSDVTVEVDLTGLRPGLHELAPTRVAVPKGITVVKVEPERIWVIIS